MSRMRKNDAILHDSQYSHFFRYPKEDALKGCATNEALVTDPHNV
jgi:hypothetical protein